MSVTTARRALAAVALSVVVVPLAACTFGGGGAKSGAADFSGVQSATIQIESEGTFVDPEDGQMAEETGRGSGFFISKDGLALTNNHVVAGAGTVKVWVGGDDSKEYDAKLLGSSECLDLAVVQVDGQFPYLDWYQGDITTGQEVYAAGFPLGDPTFTLTKGIVSKAETIGQTSWASIDSIIEHDAKIKPGNSGGPLVTAQGTVVGVDYAGNNELDTNFAIHRDEAQKVLDQLIAGSDVKSLGINAQALPPADDGSALGVWASSVKAGSPADEAGIQPGDLIMRMAGTTLAADGTLEEYCDVISTQGSDGTIDVEVYRPSDDTFYRGQFNGKPLAPVTVPGLNGSSGGSSEGMSFRTVTDDSGVLSVEIPSTWADVNGAPFTSDDGRQFLSLDASTDLAGLSSSWAYSGVTFQVTSPSDGITAQAVFDLFAGYTAQCTLDSADAYTDGVYSGQYQYYTGCGGSSDYIILAAQPDDGSYTVILTLTIASEADIPAIEHVFGSFAADFS
ncbi:S1C family serine protease [Cnuibacter sp. UC19_7]|uniref:S1C family serine protease n=1 Tax=Cnuibacter sp. UC19_7 TaxID=3350166 RepID=UPI003670D725